MSWLLYVRQRCKEWKTLGGKQPEFDLTSEGLLTLVEGINKAYAVEVCR